MSEIKKEIGVIEDIEETVIDRSELNLQQFMNDMRMLGLQVNDKKLDKPAFNYGDLGVTNYLLWLILGEMQMMNDTVEEEEFDEEGIEENA